MCINSLQTQNIHTATTWNLLWTTQADERSTETKGRGFTVQPQCVFSFFFVLIFFLLGWIRLKMMTETWNEDLWPRPENSRPRLLGGRRAATFLLGFARTFGEGTQQRSRPSSPALQWKPNTHTAPRPRPHPHPHNEIMSAMLWKPSSAVTLLSDSPPTEGVFLDLFHASI